MTIRPPAAYCLNEEIARRRGKKFASELAYCWRQHSEVSMMMAEVPISRPIPPRGPKTMSSGPATRLSH